MSMDPHRSGVARPPADLHIAPKESPTILRFHASERWLHWALAIPYVLLYATALIMLLQWGEPQPRHVRALFGWIHRAVGIALIALPPIALLWGRREWRTHLENIREGWVWTRDDVRWLLVAHRAAVDPSFPAPEQGKFNAAEKLNFMMVSTTYTLYIATGIAVWLPGTAFFPWVLHVAMAVAGLPLVGGHIFMATVNPSTRIGITGMITGWVDRGWARHHYHRWYREHFETDTRVEPPTAAELLGEPAMVRCGSCKEVHAFGTWDELLQRVFQVDPLVCPRCGTEIGQMELAAGSRTAEAIMGHLERGYVEQPLELPISEAV